MKVFYNLYRRYVQAPNHPAKLRLVRWLGTTCFPQEGFAYPVNGGVKLLLHPDDWIEFLLLKHGEYEPLTLRFIEKNLRSGETALFAGVNFGLHLMVASRCVSTAGCVLGVEPQPKALYRAYRNIMLNSLSSNIRLVSSALGGQPTVVPMDNAPEHNSGSASLVQSNSRFPFYIHVAPLQELLDKLAVERLDFMLLDVEGYELEVLQGMVAGKLPPLLVIEVNPQVLKPLGIEQRAVYDRLQSFGYSCWSLDGRAAKPDDVVAEQNVVAVLNGAPTPQWVEVAAT